MIDRVFCIDFGSSFTKVALRRDPGAGSELITPTARAIEEADFCIPSTIAVNRRDRARQKVECGPQVADLQSGDGITVYANWKKWLFQATPAGDQPGLSPLEAFLQHADLRDLAANHGVASTQLAYLAQLVGAARGLIGGPAPRGGSAEAEQQAFAAKVAKHFFLFLRQTVLDACDRLSLSGLKFEDIPVRVAVPAFAERPEHPGTQAVLAGLRSAGWPLHPDRPFVSEPASNAIGVLTNGANVVHKGKVQLATMFSKGPLITVLKSPADHPSYRAVVVDIGAYTTDFAAVTLDTAGSTVTDPEAATTITQESVPVGVSNLDDRVKALVTARRPDAKMSARDWGTLRRAVYTDGKAYKKPGLSVGGPADAEATAEVAGFGKQVAAAVEKFCAQLPPANLQELILTGGGSLCPVVREAAQQAAAAGGHTYVKTHAPGLKRQPGTPVHKLDDTFTRGGSAIGGASVYFERA